MSDRRRSTRQAALMLFLARPVFRAVDWYASYTAAAAGVLGADWADHAQRLAELDARRREALTAMGALSATHGEACALCKGGCCTEERYRDSLVDRVLQDPAQPNPAPRSLRSKTREAHVEYPPLRSAVAAAAAPRDYCPNCTPQGCTLEPADRPIQCLAYHCRESVASLSPEECETGIRALHGMMRVMMETSALPMTRPRD